MVFICSYAQVGKVSRGINVQGNREYDLNFYDISYELYFVFFSVLPAALFWS
jgi:hypothetical protein